MDEIKREGVKFGGIFALLFILTLAASSLLQFDSGYPFAFELYAYPLLCMLLHLSAAIRIGSWAVLLLDRPLPLSTRFLLGLLLLALWPMVLGAAGLLGRIAVAAPTVLLGFCWRPSTLCDAFERGCRFMAEWNAGAKAEDRFVALLLGAAGIWGLFSTMAPPVGHDAIAYHLGLADQYLIRGGITPPSNGFYHLFWHQFPMTMMPLVALDRNGIAANLLGSALFFALLFEAGGWASSRNARSGVWAAAAIATSPLALFLMAQTKDDLMAAALVVASCRVADRDFSETRDRRIILIAGFLAGGALAVKPTSILVLAPMAIAGLALPWRERLVGAFAALPLPAFWSIRNLLFSGRIYSSGMLGLRGAAEAGLSDAPLARLNHLALSFVTLIERFIEGPVGPVFLVMGGLALLVTRRGRRYALVFLLAVAFWMAAGRGQARFLLPLWFLLAAIGSPELIARGALVRWATAFAILVQLGTGIAITERFVPFVMLHSDGIAVDRYIAEWLETFHIQRVGANDLPPDARVIAMGEHRLFYLHRFADCDGYWEPSRVLAFAHASHDSGALLAKLKDRGYTHILFVASEMQEARQTGDAPPPPCDRDETVVRAMLSSCTPMMVHSRTSSGLYVLGVNRRE